MNDPLTKPKKETEMSEISTRTDVLENKCKSFSQKFCNIHRKTPALESLFTKVAGLTPTKVFSCEYREMFKNSFL